MGLSIAVSGAIIMISMVLVLYVFSGTAMNVFSLGEVSSEVSEYNDSISKSEISLHHVSTLVGSPNINLTLRNDGQVKTWRFSMYDVLVTYDGATSGKLTEQLSYSGDCLGGIPTSGSWCIQSITRDVLDPGLLNPTEEANIRLRVNENLADESAIIVISTAKGVTSKVVAPYCGPSCYQMIWDVASDEPDTQWTNIGLPGGGPEEFEQGDDAYRTTLDLIDMNEWRLVIHVEGFNAGVTTAACVLGVQYSTDGMVTWNALDNGIANAMTTSTTSCQNIGTVVNAWSQINSTAQTEVWLRVVGDDDNAADPLFGTVQVQFRS
ncbi:MAG: hypothetical protein WD650_07750 [Nitrosopumilaceae archaeon]